MCNHIGKVIKWGVDSNTNFKPALWGCTRCDWNSTEQPVSVDVVDSHNHTTYVDGCFTCKLSTLNLQTGDAKGGLIENGWTNKKWNQELKEYSDARAQGIQPKSTQTKDIRDAVAKSEKSGKAFDASKSI
jgi:hypothetical protein